jgi:hypothetical protein
MSWVKRIFHLCDTKRAEHENHILLKWPTYKHINSQFQNISYCTNLPNLLTHENYGPPPPSLTMMKDENNQQRMKIKGIIIIIIIEINEIKKQSIHYRCKQ